MRFRLSTIAAASALAIALTTTISAQDKSPDRPPESGKVLQRVPRPEDERPRFPGKGPPRREGDPRPEEGNRPPGKGPPDGARPMPPGGQGGYGGGVGYGGSREGGGYGGYDMGGGYGRGMGGMMAPGGYGGMPPGGGPPDDPEMRELVRKDFDTEREALELAGQYRRASGEEREKLKTQIAELVAKHFDIRQQRRKLQLKRMEEELSRLREAITKRDDASATLVKNRIAELIGEPRELDF
jgi:hypothetical protein